MVPVLASRVLLGPADLTTPPLAGNCGGPQLPYECQSLTYVSWIALAAATDTPIPHDGVLLLESIGNDRPRRRTAP